MIRSIIDIHNPGFLFTPIDFDYNNIPDYSGNGRGLTLGGETPPVITIDGLNSGVNGTTFNGINNAVAEGEKYDIVLTNFTIEFQFVRDTSKNGTVQVLFARWGNAASKTQYICYFDGSNILSFTIYNGSGGYHNVSTAAITNASTHSIAVVKSGSNLTLYHNGTNVSAIGSATPINTVSDDVPFRLAAHDDDSGAFAPYYGTIGNFRFSDIARYSSNYSPSSAYLTTDANTLALLLMKEFKGTYLDTAAYQSLILERTGYPQASGGWANPDGFLDTLDGKKYFSVSAFDGSEWTVWAAIADNLTSPFVVQSNPIQVPSVGEGDLAGNGSVVTFEGQYHHYYHDNPGSNVFNIRHSIGDTLDETYPQGDIVFQGGTGGYAGYIDPMVRHIDGGLEMFFCGQNTGFASRIILRSTSTDGETWTTPVSLGSAVMTFDEHYAGEPASQRIGQSTYVITGDGAPGLGDPRCVVRWASKDGTRLLPLFKYFGAVGGSGYFGTYDGSMTYEPNNNRIIFLVTYSENNQPTQPTDADIAMFYLPIIREPV